MEKKTRYLIIGLCCIFGIVLGSTTAWIRWSSSENTDVTFTIGGDVLITYNAGDDITEEDVSLRPVSTKEYGAANGYAIKKDITVSSKSETFYLRLFLEAEIFPEQLRHESLKWELYDNNANSLINSGNFSDVTEGDKLTLTSSLEITTTVKNMTLYVWIDGNMKNPSTMGGQDYKFLLFAEAADDISNLLTLDPSGANSPKLMSGMVPIEYKEDGWYVADVTTKWFNYGEKRWANAVLVTEESGLRTAAAGTPVSDTNDDVLAWYVWIPRYKYKLFNPEKKVGVDLYDAENTGIDIVFESGVETTGTVKCRVSYNQEDAGEETCANAENGNYYTHPAFWWDSNDNGIREISEELTGIWVGKFEISSETPNAEYGGGSTTDLSVRVKPRVYPWTNNNVSNFFTVIQNMMNDGNEYGINNGETDSHMLKNMEWGAVAYLTHSIYGRCDGTSCTEVEDDTEGYYDNPNYVKITGGKNYKENVEQSTTGNITGIYDMVGGSFEYVMGNKIYSDGKTMGSGLSDIENSGFNGMLSNYNRGQYNWTMKNDGVPYPDKRYYDLFSFVYSRNHLGDATAELEDEEGDLWGEFSRHKFIDGKLWLSRGGDFQDTIWGNIFISENKNGFEYERGSTRSVLVSLS